MNVKDIKKNRKYCKSTNDGGIQIRKIISVPSRGIKRNKEDYKFRFIHYIKRPGKATVFQRCESLSPELMLPWIRKATLYKGKLPKIKKCAPLLPIKAMASEVEAREMTLV